MTDTVLMAVIALFAVFGGIGISSAFYAVRLFDVQRKCAERVEQANTEVMQVRAMKRDLDVREKLYKDVPVERLLRDDDRFDPIDWSGA